MALPSTLYILHTHKTLQTAKPTAYKNHLEITIYNPSEFDITKFITEHKNILVVGHSNTIHKLVNTILKSEIYEDIDDGNFRNLYHITLLNGKVLSYVLNRY